MRAPLTPAPNATLKRVSRARRLLRAGLIFCAYAYPVSVLVLVLAFYFVGEAWWVTAAGLYAPRLPFALPPPVLAVSLWLSGARRLIWTQVLAAFIVIVPLMGFVVSWHSHVSTPTIRVFSLNADSGLAGSRVLAEVISKAAPDVVLLQEAPTWDVEFVEALRARFAYVDGSTQFVVASRYPILSSTEPERLSLNGHQSSPRFMRYVIETPLGQVAFYNVHPISPRGVQHLTHLRGVLHGLRTGALLAGDPERDMRSNVALRTRQIELAADAAARESLPVLIAGDTNLPGLSAVFRRTLSRYSDAFRVAGWGLGYTFPQKFPFLRLDRILTNHKLRAVSFGVGCEGASDHLCVVAEIQALQ